MHGLISAAGINVQRMSNKSILKEGMKEILHEVLQKSSRNARIVC